MCISDLKLGSYEHYLSLGLENSFFCEMGTFAVGARGVVLQSHLELVLIDGVVPGREGAVEGTASFSK